MKLFPRLLRALWVAPILVVLLIGIGLQVKAAPGEPPVDPTAKFGNAVNPEIPHVVDHVLVRLVDGVTPWEGMTPVFGRWYRAPVLPGETPWQALYRLGASPDIEKVELDYVVRAIPEPKQASPNRVGAYAWGYEPNDPYFPSQWNFYDVLAPEAWKRGWTGISTTVAVIDTGVNPGPDLACRTFVNPVTIISGTVTTGSAYDDNGHGTHVIGTIAQCTNNGIRDAGIAFQSKIMPIKVLNSKGEGEWSDIAAGIVSATVQGADVINLSLGSECGVDDYPACSISIVEDAIDDAVAADVVIVAAAGNKSNNRVSYPANHPKVLAVGAVDIMLDPAPYTNYGSALSLMAPGGNLAEDLNNDGLPDGIEQETYIPGDGYNDWASYFFEGTSMAAPHVSAAAALLRTAFPNASADDIRDALEASALDRGPSGFDSEFGYGVLQIDDAFCQLSGASCYDILLNGDFENTTSWLFDNGGSTAPLPVYTTMEAVTGDQAMYLGTNPPPVAVTAPQEDTVSEDPQIAGILSPDAGYYSRIYQDILVPANVDDVFIDFWYMPCTTDTSIANDWQRFWVYDPNDPTNENLRKTYMKVLEDDCVWKHVTYKINQNYKGRTLRINFSAHNDSLTNTPTWMFLDRVRLITYTYSPPPTPTPTFTPTFTPTPTDTPTPTPTPTDTPTPTPTFTPTNTPTPTDTPTPTNTPTPTDTPTPTNTPTPTFTPTNTPTPTPTPTPMIGIDDLFVVPPSLPFTVPIQMQNFPSPGIGALSLDVEYDPNVILPTTCDADPDNIFTAWTCNLTFLPGVTRLSFINPIGASGSHIIANLGFEGIGNLYDATPLTVTVTSLSDAYGDPIPAVKVADGIVVLDSWPGDVNCDATTNVVDALYILQYDTGMLLPSQQCPPPPDSIYITSCDVNNDSLCSSIDALFILQCDIGIPNVFCPVAMAMSDSSMSALASANILVGQGVVQKDGQITVPISADITDAALGAATFELTYDPTVVRPTACTADPDGKFTIAACNPTYASGAIRFTLASTQGVTGGANLANITFEAVGDPGDSSPLTATAITFTDAQGQAIPNQIRSGQIDVRSLIFLPITR